MTSDTGILLLSHVDKLLDLTRRVAQLVSDNRRQKSVIHKIQTMIQQRVYGPCLGYEDLYDQDTLKTDIANQTPMDTDQPLAGSPTLCRFESSITRETAVHINDLLIDTFIESHQYPPELLVLDFDATDDPLHGHQERHFFYGYYDCYCYLPLYVFCGQQILFALLRPSNIGAS